MESPLPCSRTSRSLLDTASSTSSMLCVLRRARNSSTSNGKKRPWGGGGGDRRDERMEEHMLEMFGMIANIQCESWPLLPFRSLFYCLSRPSPHSSILSIHTTHSCISRFSSPFPGLRTCSTMPSRSLSIELFSIAATVFASTTPFCRISVGRILFTGSLKDGGVLSLPSNWNTSWW